MQTVQFGLVQSRFKVQEGQNASLTQFDLENLVQKSEFQNGISPLMYNMAVHQYNDSFTLTSQAINQNNTGFQTPSLTDEYNAHRRVQMDLSQYYGIQFEPYDLHVVNPWHTQA